MAEGTLIFEQAETARGAFYKRTIAVELADGVSVESSPSEHSVEHTPPVGGTENVPTLAVSGNLVTFLWEVGTEEEQIGMHKLDFLIALDDGEIRACRLPIVVRY